MPVAFLSGLLSSLPAVPLPAQKPPPPVSPSSLSLPRIKSDGGVLRSPIGISADLARCPTEVLSGCFPALAWANVFYAKGGYYNAQVVVGDDEPEEVLLRRFRREVGRAGVIQECKRRRWFEDAREKRKRKARNAVRWNSKRRYHPKVHKQDKVESREQSKQDRKEQNEEEDNWEIPEGELPYCNKMP